MPQSTIGKVPRNIRGGKSGKITVSLGKMVSNIKAYGSPKKGQNRVYGKVSGPCWHTIPVVKK